MTYQDRAKELMTLALGVGISSNQSQLLIEEKLKEWDKDSCVEMASFRESLAYYRQYHHDYP